MDNFFWIGISIIIITLTLCVTSISHNNDISDSACVDIGLEKYRYIQGLEYCEDDFGNLHYINFDCDTIIKLWFIDCNAKLISIGEVRT